MPEWYDDNSRVSALKTRLKVSDDNKGEESKNSYGSSYESYKGTTNRAKKE
jgi:hypothetical protein